MAVDSMKPTVFCITERGDLLRFFDCASYMREPSDITVFGNEYYVCDFKVCIFNLVKSSSVDSLLVSSRVIGNAFPFE